MTEEPQETSSEETPENDPRQYLSHAAAVMEDAHQVLMIERGSLLQQLQQVYSLATQAESPLTEQEEYELLQQTEFILTLSAQMTIALRVVEQIGQGALQGLAQTGIRVPDPSPILGPDGEILAKPKKERKPRKEA
jgi:hypothetical protein